MLRALENAGQLDNTIIAVVGDHGYGLSELGNWGKYTLLEQVCKNVLFSGVTHDTFSSASSSSSSYSSSLSLSLSHTHTHTHLLSFFREVEFVNVAIMSVVRRVCTLPRLKVRAHCYYPVHRERGHLSLSLHRG